MKKANEQEVDQILDGLTGDVRIGQRYYIFTVTYAYICRIEKVTDWGLHCGDVTIVSRAGDAVDAVTQIVNLKAKPQGCEQTGKPLIVARQSITAMIPF